LNLLTAIEHTKLSPNLVSKDIEILVAETKKYEFFGVCVPPFWVKKAKREIADANVALISVVGFPLGYNRTETKIYELQSIIRDGADEVDMVANISAIQEGAYDWIKPEIAQMAQMAHEHEKILKVIIETAYLNDEQLRIMCEICTEAGADFVKTSTGFAPKGAEVEIVEKMRNFLPKNVAIKASGGIKTFQQAMDLINAGAERIGTSASIAIWQEYQNIIK
jgi:deoxyribose-phosphate aldolase